jgi:hypothetical protein
LTFTLRQLIKCKIEAITAKLRVEQAEMLV